MPDDGLAEVLRGWSSKAQLHAALAAMDDDWAEIRWTPADVRRRARRVMFAEMIPLLEAWPTESATWLEALPASSVRERRVSPAVGPGVDWVATRNQGRWPPSQYVHNERDRIADQQMTKALRWTLDTLDDVRKEALKVDRYLKDEARRQIEAALTIKRVPPLTAATGERPSEQTVKALAESGHPWTVLAPVARTLAGAESTDLMSYARKHLMPVEELRWRLFHLGVLGVLLKSFRDNGWSLTSHRPLSSSVEEGPHYTATDPHGEEWDVWCEAEEMWSHYGITSSYQALITAAFGQGSPMGADIAVIKHGHAAYLFECKYGSVAYVTRQGFHQVSTYAAEVRQTIAPVVEGIIVGPEDVVPNQASATLSDSVLRITGPQHLRDFLPHA